MNFKSSQPPDSWFGEVKDCTNNRIMCPQIDQRFNFLLSHGITESEDCLYLNIYVPVSVSDDQTFTDSTFAAMIKLMILIH